MRGRVRWGNVGRVAGLGAVVAVVIAWPRLGGEPLVAPGGEALPLAGPAPAPDADRAPREAPLPAPDADRSPREAPLPGPGAAPREREAVPGGRVRERSRAEPRDSQGDERPTPSERRVLRPRSVPDKRRTPIPSPPAEQRAPPPVVTPSPTPPLPTRTPAPAPSPPRAPTPTVDPAEREFGFEQ